MFGGNPLFGVAPPASPPGRSAHEAFIAAHADLRKFFAGIATRVPLARQVRPWAYWQFKNGKIVTMTQRDLPTESDFYCAWDRGIGAHVLYER